MVPTKRRPDAAVAHALLAAPRPGSPSSATARRGRPGSRRSRPGARSWPPSSPKKIALRDRLQALPRRADRGGSGEAGNRLERWRPWCVYFLRMPRTTRSAVRLTTKVMAEQQHPDDEQHLVVVRSRPGPRPARRRCWRSACAPSRAGRGGCARRGRWPSARPWSRRRPGRRRAAPRPAGRSWPPGSSTRYTICQRVAPSASAASRYESGTALSASSPMETMIGTLISARMMPPLSTLTPTGAPVSADDQRAHHGQADEAPDDTAGWRPAAR